MTRRHFKQPTTTDSLFGAVVPIIMLMASRTQSLELFKQDVIITRMERAYYDLANADEPSRNSWRDLTDAMNFLQSLAELGWSQDPDGALNDTKAALLEGQQNLVNRGKLRLGGTSLRQLRAHCDQFTELLGQLSAHSYWVAVSHTEKRIRKILRGHKSRGDVVVTL